MNDLDQLRAISIAILGVLALVTIFVMCFLC